MSEDVVSAGRRLERAGDLDGAIEHYMAWVKREEEVAKNPPIPSRPGDVPWTPAPYPYERLAIIHRKRRDTAAETEILQRYVDQGGRSIDLLERLRKIQKKERRAEPPRDVDDAWQPVCAWSGEESTMTDVFVVGAEWRVRWSHDPEKYRGDRWRSGLFELLVRQHGTDKVAQVLASCFQAASGTSHLKGPGKFYLEISANCTQWGVAVDTYAE